MTGPRRIAGVPCEKVWGSHDLSPLFPPAELKTGEIWFAADPLLVKFLFTTENLSIQVHPDDEGGRRGKTEMWHILRAEEGARIALGFREPLTREEMIAAARSGAIVDRLQWFPVRAGETYFTPARTVHAIGAGIALCEIQQYSDITYRLYDYGRPREMHLEEGARVADLGPHSGACQLPVRCQHFETGALEMTGDSTYRFGRPHLLIVLEGSGRFGEQAFAPGQVWSAGTEPFVCEIGTPARLLRTWAP